MNKQFLLFTIFSIISRTAIGSKLTSVDVRERAVGALHATLPAAHTYTIGQPPAGAADATYSDLPTTCIINDGSAPCTGTGAVLTVKVGTTSTGVVDTNDITVVVAGSGYEAGDKIIVSNLLLGATSAGNDLQITLVSADIADGSVKCGTGLLTITSSPTDADVADSPKTILAGDVDNSLASGTGISLKLTIAVSGGDTVVNAVEVLAGGSGYKVGDIIQVGVDKMDVETTDADVDAPLVLVALTEDDIDDFGKVTLKAAFRDSDGNINAFNTGITHANTVKGYYATLSKHANQIQVKATFTAGSVTPELNGVTDTTLVSTKLSRQAFPVSDGLNILKLVSSEDGTYEINLIKPDDNVKAIKMGKRSVEIAYNPGSVGEFTCSAFTDGSGLPTTRANVKTGTGSVAKSVRTHNILPENRYNSVQMTLNGLSPSTIYDIHCFHLSHGIISNTAASVETDLGSLTGVSLVPSATAAGAFPTLTLKFTHEVELAVGATITLKLYKNYESVSTVALTATGTDQQVACGNRLTIKSGSQVVTGAHTCGADNNLLTMTLADAGSTIASGTRGTEVEIAMASDDTNLHLPDNPAAGTIITFDVEVSDHGKLLQQDGWKTT